MAEIEDLGKTVLGVGLGASLVGDSLSFDGVALPPVSAGASVALPEDFQGMVVQLQDFVADGLVDASLGLAVQIVQLCSIVAYASWLLKKAFGLDK